MIVSRQGTLLILSSPLSHLKTIRNLFAIEYLKTHSPTVSEFKAIYDALDRDVIKVSLFFFSWVTLPLTILSLYRNTKHSLAKRNEKVHQLQADSDSAGLGLRITGTWTLQSFFSHFSALRTKRTKKDEL